MLELIVIISWRQQCLKTRHIFVSYSEQDIGNVANEKFPILLKLNLAERIVRNKSTVHGEMLLIFLRSDCLMYVSLTLSFFFLAIFILFQRCRSCEYLKINISKVGELLADKKSCTNA